MRRVPDPRDDYPSCPGCGQAAPPGPYDPADRGCACDWWCHGCLRRTSVQYWRHLARRRWGRALWVTGAGPFACVADCGPGVTVTLWRTRAEAESALGRVDRLGCGHRCRRAHRVVTLEDVA